MAKMLYSATMSLDGFIAGPGGDMSWLTEHIGPNPMVDELIGRIGALLVGNRTFRGDDPYKGTNKDGKPFGGGWSGPQFVLTHPSPAASRQRGPPRVTSTSTSWAPTSPGSASTRGCSTRSSCSSHPSCSATAYGCSTARVEPRSSSNASA